ALNETNVTTAEQMREVAKYCIIDALSCQRLMIKRNVINEYREVASIAFISLFDTHYFAIGMKVSNLLSASAWREGILTSTISERMETESFPGAYVFPPMKGLENKRPVTGLDFASLYPSLIMTYNLSPDKIILSRKHAESLRDSGKRLHEINFKFNGNDVLAWSIEHNNIPEEKGLYAKILEYLSSKRNEIKKRLAPLKERKEDMELVIGLMGKGLSLPEAIEYVLAKAEEKKRANLNKNLYYFINKEKHEFMAEYDSVCFDYSCFDAKQNALKVYMNTFYNTAGDSKSIFFLRELAKDVISAEQRNIKLVADFVKNKRFGIKYKECFQEYDEAYDNGNGISKEKYWSRIVQISMKEIGILCDEVNTFLREDNGSSYLKIAYKEVLFPVVFTGKKKYYSIRHESKPNFNKELFIRGVEIVDNSCTLHQIIKNILRKTVKDISQTNLNEIIKTAVWRSDKDNKSDLIPKPYLYQIPEPGERFKYVVVENNSLERVGDKMEYPEVARQLGKKIDISYYLKSVVSLCARFINYDELFQPSSEIVLEVLKKLKDGNKADEYNEELGLAFEYSGNQHYQIVPFFHLQDQVNLDTQIWRDW
ncbi:12734_t:CDS:2, partial [Funneliformis geosporum]